MNTPYDSHELLPIMRFICHENCTVANLIRDRQRGHFQATSNFVIVQLDQSLNLNSRSLSRPTYLRADNSIAISMIDDSDVLSLLF